jgi:hypothetical protein
MSLSSMIRNHILTILSALITKIAAVENTTAIWEYDPTRPDNRVLGGSLDVIAAIRTLAIKVRLCIFKIRVSHSPASDPSIWTAYRVLSKYPDPLWTSGGGEDTLA